ncbi:MAG TPA: hypothetical protein VFB72_05185 [Verrucomicrobiae bacterium]|nr:hypothetical protein [Verrucomicrobiae bacterium]
MADTPIERFVLLVLFQAQQDGATELKFPPANATNATISYQVDGKWHDFAPPPAHILPQAINELLRIAGIQDAPFPKEGVINVQFSSGRSGKSNASAGRTMCFDSPPK